MCSSIHFTQRRQRNALKATDVFLHQLVTCTNYSPSPTPLHIHLQQTWNCGCTSEGQFLGITAAHSKRLISTFLPRELHTGLVTEMKKVGGVWKQSCWTAGNICVPAIITQHLLTTDKTLSNFWTWSSFHIHFIFSDLFTAKHGSHKERQ